MKNSVRAVALSAALICLTGCAGGKGGAADDRAALIAACEVQQGIGWLRKEYGDDYCSCWADAAKTSLDTATYAKLAQVSQAQLKIEDKDERENLARGAFEAFARASDAARATCKK